MSFEDEYVRRVEKKNPINAFLPLLGFLLILALGAVSYVLSGPAHEFLQNNIANFPFQQEIQYVVGGVIFVTLVLLSGFFYAIFAPKPTKLISEKQLKKERADKDKERRARKKRQRQLALKAAEERRKQTK